MAADSNYPAIAPNFFAVGEALCYGDSGGPVLAQSGAVVGIASYFNNPNVQFPTLNQTDCIGSDVRSIYQATNSDQQLIMDGFAAAQATPWIEGQPDPRASLANFESACTSDADCQSNACVPDVEGTLRCTVGCLGNTPCPAGYQCQEVPQHQRCVEVATPDAGSASTSSTHHGCEIAPAPRPFPLVFLGCVFALLYRLRRKSQSGRGSRKLL